MNDFIQFFVDIFTYTVLYLSGIGIAIAAILILIYQRLKKNK